MKTDNLGRHGDLNFRAVDKAEGRKVELKEGKFVLALGEHTGHKHVISVPRMEDMDIYEGADGGYFLVLRSEGTLTHEEHKPITFAPGTYKMGTEREFDYMLAQVRKVQD